MMKTNDAPVTSVKIGQLVKLHIDLMDSDEEGQDRWTSAGAIGRVDCENSADSWVIVFPNGAAQIFDLGELNNRAECTLMDDDHPEAKAAHAAIEAMKNEDSIF